jgi:hypothetical protein
MANIGNKYQLSTNRGYVSGAYYENERAKNMVGINWNNIIYFSIEN